MQYFFPKSLANLAAALPVVSLTVCVLWTVHEDPFGITRTHCAIPNFVPSLSASVGEGVRKRLWLACIGISCALRLFIHASYNSLVSKMARSKYVPNFLLVIHFWTHLLEIICLFILTVVTSSENFPIHRDAFGMFIIMSAVFGLLDINILSRLQNVYPTLAYTIRRKSRLYLIMLVSICLSFVCYTLHNIYCISHLYSVFALCEHIFILSNVAFHYSIVHVSGDMVCKFIPESIM